MLELKILNGNNLNKNEIFFINIQKIMFLNFFYKNSQYVTFCLTRTIRIFYI